jgi:hypothetical protein
MEKDSAWELWSLRGLVMMLVGRYAQSLPPLKLSDTLSGLAG